MNLCGSVVKALNMKSSGFARVGSNPAADALPYLTLRSKQNNIRLTRALKLFFCLPELVVVGSEGVSGGGGYITHSTN